MHDQDPSGLLENEQSIASVPTMGEVDGTAEARSDRDQGQVQAAYNQLSQNRRLERRGLRFLPPDLTESVPAVRNRGHFR